MKRMRILLTAIVVVGMSNVVSAQWTTSGNDLYNTNYNLSPPGKVGIGKIPTPDGANTGNPPYIYSNKTPVLQISGPGGYQSPPDADFVLPIVGIESPGYSAKLNFGISKLFYPSSIEYSFIKSNARISVFCPDFYVQNKASFGNKVIITSGANSGFLSQNVNQPAGYNLYVTGGILTEKIKVAVLNSSNWADYVFDKEYKLLSLGEVESYIQKNKHLPGVPSAEEVVKDGIDMATMDAKLLEKIEELTLYVIELKKEVELLKAEKK